MDPRIINTFLGKIRNWDAKKCPAIPVMEAVLLLLPVVPRRESWWQAAKCHTWAEALILYHPYHWTNLKYHYLRIFYGDSAGCSEQFRVKDVYHEPRPNPCHIFVYRAGNWSLPCCIPGQIYIYIYITSSSQILLYLGAIQPCTEMFS